MHEWLLVANGIHPVSDGSEGTFFLLFYICMYVCIYKGGIGKAYGSRPGYKA